MLWRTCVCGAAAACAAVALAGSGCSNGGGGAADAAPEASAETGVPDTGPKDTGAKDTGTVMDTGPTCPTPGDVTGFAPGALHNPVAVQDVCSETDVGTYYTSCIDMYNMSTCDAFTQAHMSCATCLETLDNSMSQWGASYDRAYFIFLNVSGCVKQLGDTACAQALQNVEACEDYACMDLCWNNSQMMQADLDNLDMCWTNVAKAGCKKYVDMASTACNAADANSAFSQCEALNPMNDFATGFKNYAAMFCRGGG